MHRALAAVALIVSLPLLLGAIAHAYAPHQHPENAAIVDLMHTAAAAGEKTFVVVPLFAALFIYALTAVALAAPLRRRYALEALSIEEARGQSLYVRRGRARYRRFI